MRLGVNGWRLHGQRTGVGRYLYNLVKHWTPEMVAGRFAEINFYTPAAMNRQDILLPEAIRERVLRSQWPMLVWENLRLAPVAGDDVLFCPSYSRPLFTRGKTVVVTHDATSQLYPSQFPRSVRLFYNRLYGWSARHATLVITSSEAARRDIARCWGVSPEKIRVTRLAPAEVFRPLPGDPRLSEVRQRYVGSSVPFFLFVGKLSGRRNLPTLLQAFAAFKRRTSAPHKLLLVGPETSAPHLADLSAELGIGEHLVPCPYVADEELNLVYNAAEAFVMPSIYETLSLPVLEAQATGTPVICVDTPGARESTGGAALLIPRLEVEKLVEGMSRLADDADLRRALGERGLANIRRFSWQRCATETLAVLAEAVHPAAVATSAPQRTSL